MYVTQLKNSLAVVAIVMRLNSTAVEFNRSGCKAVVIITTALQPLQPQITIVRIFLTHMLRVAKCVYLEKKDLESTMSVQALLGKDSNPTDCNSHDNYLSTLSEV